MATGDSSSRVRIFAMALAASRTSPSEGTNSVVTIAAPASRHRMRKDASVTSSIGAKTTGRAPRSMFPIFTLQRYDNLVIYRIMLTFAVPKKCGERSNI